MCNCVQSQWRETPYGVAMDDEENVLVSDSDNHRIQKFTAQGKFLTVVGTPGDEPLP